jgi:ABC-type sulfate/molybdate transport systems ATPase subunit
MLQVQDAIAFAKKAKKEQERIQQTKKVKVHTDFTLRQLELLERSLEHSVKSGQFFFTRDETEELREMLDECRRQNA